MSILLTTIILTVALLTPSLAKESQNIHDTPVSRAPETSVPDALHAPKTAFLTIEDYAEEAAREAGIDPIRFQRLIMCESRWREDAAGDNGTSVGLLQFKEDTFAHFVKKYPAASEADIRDPRRQIDLAAAMIADGYLHHWKNCSRKIGWSDEI
ncbi:MAG: transglycosylase SLT domain-containing protein [Patescibacteria group bacterium]